MRQAAEGLAREMSQRDPLFAPWAGAALGEPVLVHTIAGQPSYWTVPVTLGGRAIGFVRVSLQLKAVVAGAHYRDPHRLESAPATVTGIDADEALVRAQATMAGGETIADPLYVHDGPPGREAWMIAIRDPDGLLRTVFVTPGGLYEREPADIAEQLDLE